MTYTLVFRRYAPFESFGGGFEGDSRSAGSTSPTATARTIGAVAFGPSFVGATLGSSSGSTFVGLGARVEQAIGRHFSKVKATTTVKTSSSTLVSFVAETAGANPLVPGAPNIVTIVDFVANFSVTAIIMSATVRGDDFPNAEVIAYDFKGTGLLLFDFATSGGQTTGPFTRLPSLTQGGHDSQTIGTFAWRVGIDSSGSFLGTPSGTATY